MGPPASLTVPLGVTNGWLRDVVPVINDKLLNNIFSVEIKFSMPLKTLAPLLSAGSNIVYSYESKRDFIVYSATFNPLSASLPNDLSILSDQIFTDLAGTILLVKFVTILWGYAEKSYIVLTSV